MSRVTESYLKVPYELRPAKQIERRMLLDAFQAMSQVGFGLRDYKYVGFGSISFVDYFLLHKYLGISRMVSLEHSSEIKKRVLFNRPFEDLIEMRFGPASDYIPKLDPDLKHIVWLDYDYVLTRDMVLDVQSAASKLSSGSILLITVDAEPPTKSDRAADWMHYFVDEVGDLLGKTKIKPTSFVKDRLVRVNIDVLKNAIQNALAGRSEVQFLPIFNFVYADGHRMLTLGGMIGGRQERSRLDSCDFGEDSFVRRDLAQDPFSIRVPILTRKERIFLDARMPCRKNWKPSEFELSREDIDSYRATYRYFPSYFEALL